MLLAATSMFATTIVMPTDEQLIAKSPVIVEGTVIATTPFMRNNAVWTETTVAVARALKGDVADNVTIREIGGVVDNRITKIFGSPEFSEGQHVLLFLTKTPRGDYQTTDLFIGKFDEERTLDGRMLWARHDDAGDVSLLDSNFNPIASRNVQRDAAAFSTYVKDRIAGRTGAKNYGIENPVLDTINDGNDGGRRAHANFTVISEPTIYRWGMFDTGGTARWYSAGTQPAYSGGGVTEMQTAMAVWTGYASARINYTYSGLATGALGGLSSANGVNEVLFNDPKSEIAGSWNPATGGVVGTGGFNGTSGSASWTSPFAADATHTQRTYTAINISEGNLTIQDNVSSTTGINSSRLAEILAHEFGHTLGFGHSTDNTSLMYPSVTGLGPSLRADDQLAARWLYPNGAQQPPPGSPAIPSAPTNLTGTPSGSSVTINWIDNANNETGQSIYVASGTTGAFSKAADIAANATTATLTGFSNGTYRIYVVATNSAGTSAQSNTLTVTIGSSSSVQAIFNVSAISGTAGQTSFAFTDQSTGTITSRLWQFADGTTSTQQNPTHVFASAGQYNVSLTVNGSGGATSTATRTIYISSSASTSLVAGFTFTPSNPTTSQDVSFIDQSTGGVTSWQWSFGDGSSSTQQNPTKRYSSAGAYTATLTVFRNLESSSTSRSIIVSAPIPAAPPVVAAFSWSPSNPQNGQSVTFDDASSGSPATWLWNFGDGSTSSLQRPSHAFASAGAYTVTLTAANGGSSASTSHSLVVTQAVQTTRALVSATAQTNGVGGSVWRTELTLFNAGDSVSIDMIYMPNGGSTQTRTIFLGSKQSVTYANALLDIFGLSNGAGAMAIEATNNSSLPNIKISSRTFTNGASGTYGQAVPDVTSSDLSAASYLTGLASNASYRTNIGIVNRGNTYASATMQLWDANGGFVGTSTVSLPPNSFQQASLATYFSAAALRSLDVASIDVVSSTPGAVSVYGSVIDNRTQDPIYVQAAPLRGSNSDTIIPAVGRAPGVNGTFWRSDVTMFNPSSSMISVSLRLLNSGSDNRGAAWQSVAIGARQSLVLGDIASRFTTSSNVNGALQLAWSGIAPVITSRTYTTQGDGTFGQSIDPVASYASDHYVPGLRSDSSFRSNGGFVNSGDATMGVVLSLISTNGLTLATGFVTVPPMSQVQYSLASLFPGLNVANLGSVTLKAHTDSGPSLFAYGSIVDNASGDPVFFGGK